MGLLNMLRSGMAKFNIKLALKSSGNLKFQLIFNRCFQALDENTFLERQNSPTPVLVRYFMYVCISITKSVYI